MLPANGQAPQTSVDESGAREPLGVASAKWSVQRKVGGKPQPQIQTSQADMGVKLWAPGLLSNPV